LVFEDLFRKSAGRPVLFKGKLISLMDCFRVPLGESAIQFRFVSTNSEWRQGIGLSAEKGLRFGRARKLLKSVVLWEDTALQAGEFLCKSKTGDIEVKNEWDTGEGVIESWHNGAAMWVEEIPDGRRYHCNDGHPDENFDDIIFELTILKESH